MYRFLFALVFVMGGFLFCSPTFAQEGGFAGDLLLGQGVEWKFKAIGAGLAVIGAALGIGKSVVRLVKASHDSLRWHQAFRALVLSLLLLLKVLLLLPSFFVLYSKSWVLAQKPVVCF